MQKNKNLIFILIDALRADHLGCYGYRKNTSPVIDNIARKSVIFNNAFCCVNVTDPSITSIFTGKYPKNNGIIHHGINVTKQEIQNFYNSKIKTLTIRLKEQGYKTYCIDWLGRWHKQGFDYYMGVSGRTKKRAFVDKILDILSKNKLVHRFATKLYHSTIFRSLSDKMSPFPIAKKLTKKDYHSHSQLYSQPF